MSTSERLHAVDSLRGVAASMVAVYHFYNALGARERVSVVPAGVDAVLQHGDAGVHIFFVLSGLVVFLNLVQFQDVQPSFLARFVVRRSVRLDPPYWLAILLSLVASAVAGRIYADGWSGLLANMLYLYNLLEIRPIVTVGWTLCLELQFYVILAIAFVLADRVRRVGVPRHGLIVAFLAPALIWSLLVAGHWAPEPIPGLFVTHWHLFLLGTAVGFLMRGETVAAALLGVVAVPAALLQYRDVGPVVALATACFIWALHRRGQLGKPIGGRAFQYLGKISYSLYLVHPVIGNRSCRWMVTHFPEASKSPWFMLAGIIGASALSLLVAHIVWRFVEHPAQRFARKISLQPERVMKQQPEAA